MVLTFNINYARLCKVSRNTCVKKMIGLYLFRDTKLLERLYHS